MPELLLYRDLV